MNHPVLRKLVDEANALTTAERVTLLKGLVPQLAKELNAKEYDGLITELRMKGERYHEAREHPGEGRATRQKPGEREIEGR